MKFHSVKRQGNYSCLTYPSFRVFKQGILTEGEGSVQFTSVHLLAENNDFLPEIIFFLFYKAAYFNEEVGGIEHSLSVRVPCFT